MESGQKEKWYGSCLELCEKNLLIKFYSSMKNDAWGNDEMKKRCEWGKIYIRMIAAKNQVEQKLFCTLYRLKKIVAKNS